MTTVPSLSVNVRLERACDAAPVRAVLESAFGRPAEAELVDRLRASSDLVLALVAERPDGHIVGHIAFPRLSIESPSGRVAAAGLAPLAVASDVRRRGVAALLVRSGLALLTDGGESLVFVLGDPAYYTRFGFDVAAAASFVSPYCGPHFMLLRLTGTAPLGGTVSYPSAFADLG
jgi:putative acetyltransferase